MNLQTHLQGGRTSILPLCLLSSALAVLIALSGSALFAQAKKPAKNPASTTSASKKQPAKRSTKKRTTRSRARGQSAPTSDRIREIQEALAKAGNYSGEPNGKWDSATGEAMRKFQEAQGLKPTGKLDALTLQKLGLGSPFAGVAPPRTSASATANSNR
jgi:peptidoglycan hydrolase-like protein with peptidoglycan-binding domain